MIPLELEKVKIQTWVLKVFPTQDESGAISHARQKCSRDQKMRVIIRKGLQK
jgi:hypothetical protein